MNYNKIRHYLYETYTNSGGIFDEYGFLCSPKIIEAIINELKSLKKTDLKKYHSILKMFIIDSYGYFEETLFFVDEDFKVEYEDSPMRIENTDSTVYVFDESGGEEEEDFEEVYGDILSYYEQYEEQLADNFEMDLCILEIMEKASGIEEFDSLLDDEFFEQILAVELSILHKNITEGYPLALNHFDSLNAPKKIKVLAKYFSPEEINELFYKTVKTCIEDQDLEETVLELFWYLFDYCWVKDFTDEEIVKENYELYLNLLTFFHPHDTFFYEIGRSTYASLLRKLKTEEIIDERIKIVAEKLSNPNYLIRDLKMDLIPRQENNIPELFKMFILYSIYDDTSEFLIAEEIMNEVYDELGTFDDRFQEVHKLYKTKD